MRILVNGVNKPRVRRVARTFTGGPAVVGACDSQVDLFPSVLADVIDEGSPRSRLEREREGISQSKCPDCSVDSRSRIIERVVGRNRTIVVEPEYFPEKVVQRLRIRRIGILADSH